MKLRELWDITITFLYLFILHPVIIHNKLLLFIIQSIELYVAHVTWETTNVTFRLLETTHKMTA